MKRILPLCCFLVGCSTFDNWSRPDRALYVTSTSCAVTDYLQTESALDTGKFAEANPLFGSHPSDERLATITGVRIGAHWYLAETVPERWRTEIFSATLTPCLLVIIHNHKIGVRIDL